MELEALEKEASVCVCVCVRRIKQGVFTLFFIVSYERRPLPATAVLCVSLLHRPIPV